MLIAEVLRNEELSTRELITGIGVLAVFLAVCYVIGRAVARVKNYWFVKHWKPLEPVLTNPRITADGGVAVTSRLSGTYRDASVHALMTPNVQRYRYSDGNGNRFSVAIDDVAGAQDWSVLHSTGIPLLSPAGWSVSASDAALQARIVGAGIVEMIEPLGIAAVRYRTRDRVLEWSANIEPLVTLSPEQFRRVLDVLMDVALANRSVNW